MAWDGMESVLFTVASMGCILDLRKDFIYGFLQKVHGLAFFWEFYWLLILQKCPLWTEGLKVMVLLHRPFLLPPIPIFDRINSNQALFVRLGKQVISEHLAELLLQNCLKVFTSTQSQNLTKGVRCSHQTLWQEIQHSKFHSQFFPYNATTRVRSLNFYTFPLCTSVKEQPRWAWQKPPFCWNNLFLLIFPVSTLPEDRQTKHWISGESHLLKVNCFPRQTDHWHLLTFQQLINLQSLT